MVCLRLVSALLLVVSAHGFCNTMQGTKRCERYVGRFDVTCEVLGPRPGLMSHEACHALCEADGRQGCCENNANSNCQMCLPSSGALDEDSDGIAQTVEYAAVCSSCEAGTTGISGSTECFDTVYCKTYTCTGDTLLKSDAATIIGGDDVTCCDDWTTTFAACTIGDQKAKCPNDPAKCVSDLTSDELISVCGEFKKKGSPCDTDPLALQSLSAPCATCKAYTCSAGALLSNAAMLTGADDATCCDDTDIAGGSTTLSASILAFVGSFVILLA